MFDKKSDSIMIWSFVFWFIFALVFGGLVFTGCGMGRYHLVYAKQEPDIVQLSTGKICKRAEWGFTETESLEYYRDCDIIIKRSQERAK